jgi:hypothetical protein
MSNGSASSIAVARDIHLQLAGTALTPAMAKLYSQYTRYTTNQPSLAHWRSDEAEDRLDDAVRLIDSALLKRDAGDQDWYHGMRRAAELLEWLSHPRFNLKGTPTHLLAAAAYQIAGYPAMAASLIDRRVVEQPESRLLRALLKADFPRLFSELVRFWQSFDVSELLDSTPKLPSSGDEAGSAGIENWIIREVASALGVLCAQVRWGDEQRFESALSKLEATSSLFLYGGSAYSWLLSKLVSDTSKSLGHRLLRYNLMGIVDVLSQEGRNTLELYARDGYLSRRAVLWPSQIQGMKRLRDQGSFVLCTPTGSGKTTVAELGILQSIFAEQSASSESYDLTAAPLALYLVPNRALAAEVESKLSRILRRVSSSNNSITVTGLYGGTDWGPTDAWLTMDGMTVLICTYEKSEALIRFLGPLFLNRLRLVVIDEIHAIEFNGRYEELRSGENRALRLESLCTRLLTYVAKNNTRIIGLSAMAAGIDNTLAKWIRGAEGAEAISTNYRSTRQLIGRLECLANRSFVIRYDLLDGASLEFSEQGTSETPFIASPFPPYPAVPAMENGGPEKRLRPYLYWAAMHLAQSSGTEGKTTVLIFVPQQIGGYAEDFLNLLEVHWRDVRLPEFFEHPVEPDKVKLWERCLNSCADYFSKQSREYRLLANGVIVHHGRMPRLLSRLFVEAIEERIVNLVIATSTLSEGVNLPFEVLLVPTLHRGQSDITPREFGNLVGRTGRPGVATEGRALVLLPRPPNDWSSRQAWERYRNVVNGLSSPVTNVEEVGKGCSPLAELLRHLRAQWHRLPKSTGMTFEQWLEETQPLEIAESSNKDEALHSAVDSLDSLDAFLLPILVELKQLSQSTLAPAKIEEQIAAIWRRTYAYYASTETSELAKLFTRRANAIMTRVYPDQNRLRQLYRTGLPPRSGDSLLKLYSAVISHLEHGDGYVLWPKLDQFEFIRELVAILRSHPRFKSSDTLGSGKNVPRWAEVLEWWLNPTGCRRRPPAKDVSRWYEFVYGNFDYRFNWGFSSILSIAFDEAHEGSLKPLTLTDWPSTGLPWIAFWMKELIVWGILDPVAAFLMSRRLAWTRQEAETAARDYYSNQGSVSVSNDLLNPLSIRDWCQSLHFSEQSHIYDTQIRRFSVHLLRDFSKTPKFEFRVIPVEMNDNLVWLDPAGFPLAKSGKPNSWSGDNLGDYDFILQSKEQVVVANGYLELSRE